MSDVDRIEAFRAALVGLGYDDATVERILHERFGRTLAVRDLERQLREGMTAAEALASGRLRPRRHGDMRRP